jgi:hypothetical protein
VRRLRREQLPSPQTWRVLSARTANYRERREADREGGETGKGEREGFERGKGERERGDVTVTSHERECDMRMSEMSQK